MLTFDGRADFPFFCVSNETQAIVRAYSAICTPEFFVGFDSLLPGVQHRVGPDALPGSADFQEPRCSFSLCGG